MAMVAYRIYIFTTCHSSRILSATNSLLSIDCTVGITWTMPSQNANIRKSINTKHNMRKPSCITKT